MKKWTSLLIGLFIALISQAQIIDDPTTWSFSAKKIKGAEYEIQISCKLKKDWHIWSLNPGGDGLLVAPSFDFKKSGDYALLGKMKESGKVVNREFAGTDGVTHSYFNLVRYTQKMTVKKNTVIRGEHMYQVCNESMCLPPVSKKFEFSISDYASNSDSISDDDQANVQDTANNQALASATPPTRSSDSSASLETTSEQKPSVAVAKSGSVMLDDVSKEPLWKILLIAFLAGLAAVTTPCIYSMVPLTVSLFTKQNNDRKEGIKKATFYAISIVLIFALLGMIITAVWGSDGLYRLSTNWIANLFFFTLFVLFGISFLGAFEIKLPASWSTAADKKSSAGSYFGIFFMALTLVIVSFSCTSAFIGGIAVWAAKGGFWGPLLGFGMFGLGLGLPFAFFAMFPGYLKNLEKPGGWQNSLKVTLGFLELGLALKFLSNADLVRGWRLLDREIFLSIWIILAILLGIYLLGKLKLFNDSELPKNYFDIPYVSTVRLFLSGICFVFALYLIPGLFGAPLNAMSAFLPPLGTQDFVLGASGSVAAHESSGSEEHIKFRDDLKIYEPATVKSLGLHTYFDYEQAKAAAKKAKKPLMLDFTGITCPNCRKMESQVWSSPEVLKRLKEDFVIVSLFCDAIMIKTDYKDEAGETLSLGQYNLNLQKSHFNSNSQPLYFFLDDKESLLASKGYGYDPNIEAFIQHLENVKAKYKELNP